MIDNFFSEAEIATATVTDPLKGKSRKDPCKGTLTIQEVVILDVEGRMAAWESLGFVRGKEAEGAARLGVSKNGHCMVMFSGVFAPDDGPEGEVFSPIADVSCNFCIVPVSTMAEKSRNGWISASAEQCAPLFAVAGHDLAPNDVLKRLMPAQTQGDAEGVGLNGLPAILAEMAAAAQQGTLVARYGACYVKDRKSGREQVELVPLG